MYKNEKQSFAEFAQKREEIETPEQLPTSDTRLQYLLLSTDATMLVIYSIAFQSPTPYFSAACIFPLLPIAYAFYMKKDFYMRFAGLRTKPRKFKVFDKIKRNRLVSHQNSGPSKSSRRMSEELELLKKFKKVCATSSRVKEERVANYLGLTHDELFAKLMDWSDNIPFIIEGEYIVPQDTFAEALDREFEEWKEREESKDGKN